MFELSTLLVWTSSTGWAIVAVPVALAIGHALAPARLRAIRAIATSGKAFLLSLALAAGEVQTAHAQGAVGEAAAQLLANERALADAVHRRDGAQIEELLAEDYVLRSAPDVDRATWLRNALTLCWGDQSDIDDFELWQQGDVAIASFVLTFYVAPQSCRPAVLRSLITDVWARQEQGWRLRLRHSGPVPADGTDIPGQYGIVPQPPPTWKLDAELSAVATGGNTSTRTLGVGGSVGHRSDAATTDARLTFLTSEADGATQARSVTAQGRYARHISERTDVFGRADYVRDRFAGIEHRSHLEVGLARTAVLTPRLSWSSALGVGVTVEDRLDDPDLQFATTTASLAFGWALRPDIEVKDEAMLVLDLESGRNWRATNALEASVTLTRLLSFKASQAVEYRSQPVPGFLRADLRSSVALVLAFERRPPAR